MVSKTDTNGFGHKGVGDHAQSFAEQLLTGKPISRDARRDRGPKLKPRPKPVFGRGDTDARPAFATPWPVRSKPETLVRRYGVRAAIAVVIVVPTVLMVLSWAPRQG